MIKKSIFCLVVCLLLPVMALAGYGDWTWMSGANTTWQTAIYGTKGVPDAANVPGARESCVSWIDTSGNLWLFGGYGMGVSGEYGALNELWRYNISSGQWTWMSGSDTVDQPGVYGTMGVPDAANVPGSRWSSISWTDNSGNFWLFGGGGVDDYHNDLWRYDPDTNMWTWMSGSKIYPEGVYGTKGVPDAANVPDSREKSVSWTDSSGNLWLFGGQGNSLHNDLWRYEPDTGMWTWMNGSNTGFQSGVYGTMGVPDAANVPGSRWGSISWTDDSGNFWLFGGQGLDSDNSHSGYLNDLWRYEPDTNMWTWMSGSDTKNQDGVYGTMGVPDAANMPGGHFASVSWSDTSDNLWLFGGDLGQNDLWRYEPDTGMWTWMSGSDTFCQNGAYGTMGVPDAANVPEGRSNSVSWTDSTGNLWLFGGWDCNMSVYNDLWRYDIAQECNDDNDCSEGEVCVDGNCQSAVEDNPPALGDGPYLAAGYWPLLPTGSPENPTYLNKNYYVLWTFSDDFASCSGDCTHSAEYSVADSGSWTSLTVSSDAEAGYAYAELPITGLQNATTYAFRFTVTDCAGQSTQSGEYYFRVATSDAPPVIATGPFVAAGAWPRLPKSLSSAFVFDRNYSVLWTFSDDYASCGGDCTHRARYRKVDAVNWTWIQVGTDSSGKWYALTELPIESMEPGDYMFHFDVLDCAGQRTGAPNVYYFKVAH